MENERKAFSRKIPGSYKYCKIVKITTIFQNFWKNIKKHKAKETRRVEYVTTTSLSGKLKLPGKHRSGVPNLVKVLIGP